MSGPKVCHLSVVHRPRDTRIFCKECKSLARRGYQVVYVTPAEESKDSDGVRIEALEPAKSRWRRMTLTAWQAYRKAAAQDAAIYHFHDPELMLVGCLLKLKGARVVYDVHEDRRVQTLNQPWIPRPLRRIAAFTVAATERVAACVFDGVVAATPTIAERFPDRKTVTVRNFPIQDELALPAPQPYAARPNVAAYVGAMTSMRGAIEMAQAIGRVPDALDARLELAGPFRPPELADEIARLPGGARTAALGWLSRQEVAELFGRARVGLVLLHPRPNFLDSLPVKLFEYMSVGLPVVASNFPLWREIVEGAGCGFAVDPFDVDAVAQKIAWLFEHPGEAEAMGNRGQEAVKTRYNWDVEEEKLAALYQRLLEE